LRTFGRRGPMLGLEMSRLPVIVRHECGRPVRAGSA